jgi:RNase P subunit RPR2
VILRKSMRFLKNAGEKTSKATSKAARATAETTKRAASAAGESTTKVTQNVKSRLCPGCGKAFVDSSRVKVRVSGRNYHRECIACAICSLPFSDAYAMDDQDRPVHEECASGNTDVKRCKRCGIVLESGDEQVQAGADFFHKQCFLCAKCGQPFSEEFTTQRGSPYHVACWDEVQAGSLPLKRLEALVVKCKKCKRPFGPGDEKVSALDRTWHKACFVCARCNNPFGPDFGQDFSQRAKHPYHMECAQAYDEEEAAAAEQREEAKRMKQREKEALAAQKKAQRDQKRAQQAVANVNKKLRAAGGAISWHGARAAAIGDQMSAGGDGILTIYRGDPVVVLNLNVLRNDDRVPLSLWPSGERSSEDVAQHDVVEAFASGCVGFVASEALDLAPSLQQLQHTEQNKEAVLASRDYTILWDSLAVPDLVVAESLSVIAPPEDMQAVAKVLIHTLIGVPEPDTGSSLLDVLLRRMCHADVASSQDESTLFRTNSVATHTLNEHFKLFGREYLRHVLEPLWKSVNELIAEHGNVESSVEVDPMKLGSGGPPAGDVPTGDVPTGDVPTGDNAPAADPAPGAAARNDSDTEPSSDDDGDGDVFETLEDMEQGNRKTWRKDMENDLPMNAGGGDETNSSRLADLCKIILDAISKSASLVPEPVLLCCSMLAQAVTEGGYPGATHTVISGYFFLRALTPCLASPDGFKLLEPEDNVDIQKSRRAFVLVSKVLQAVCNGTQLREEFMQPLNTVVDEYSPRLKTFMDELITSGSEVQSQPQSERPDVDAAASQRVHRVVSANLAKLARAADGMMEGLDTTPEIHPLDGFFEALAMLGPAV